MEIIYGWGSFAVRYMLSLCVRPCLCLCTADATILKLLMHVSISHVNLQTVWLFYYKEQGNSDSKSEIWVLTALLALELWSRFSEVKVWENYSLFFVWCGLLILGKKISITQDFIHTIFTSFFVWSIRAFLDSITEMNVPDIKSLAFAAD